MIDFRYHIVSLISVFLALAVGIVLGAGPLRDYIAESLSGQVEQLREETEALRADRDANVQGLNDANGFIREARPALVSGVLPSYSVSIIAMPGVSAGVVTEVASVIAEAGGSVLNIVGVTGDFVDPAKRPFRSGIAGNVTTYMDPRPGADASAESIIGAALGQGLAGYDPRDPQQAAEESLSILELLTTSELITLDSTVLPTHLNVVLTSAEAGEDEILAAQLGLIKGLDPSRTLVAGVGGPDTLLNLVRADSDARAAYTTTDSLDTEPGMIILPRALALIADGGVGAFGFGDGAGAVFPPSVDLQAPAPIEPEGEEEEPEAHDQEEEAAA